MAFTNQFKSLAAVLKHYQIHYKEADFEIIKTAKLNEAVREDIFFTLKEVAYDVSEAAICKFNLSASQRGVETIRRCICDLESCFTWIR